MGIMKKCLKVFRVVVVPSGRGPAYSGPYAKAFLRQAHCVNQEGRSLINDVCECVRD